MYKYAFLVFLTLYFWVITFNSAQQEFTTSDVLGILTITLIVLLVQILFIRVLNTSFCNKFATNLICASFITFNAYSTNLILYGHFIQRPFYLKIVILLIGLFIFSSMLKMMDEIKRSRIWMPALTFLLLTGNITFGYLKYTAGSDNLMLALKNYRFVEFQKKPNIYILFFDSLIPEKILKKYMGLDKTEYHDVLNDKFYRFKNFFVDGAPTRQSIISFMALDRKYYASLGWNQRNEIFRGKTESLLLRTFRQNGYETSTSIDTEYFGSKKGPYVDNYLVRNKFFAACKFIPEASRAITFFGYCKLLEHPLIIEFLKPKKTIFAFIIDNFKKGLSKSKPQLYINSICSRGPRPMAIKTGNI